MTDDEIVAALRAPPLGSAVELAERLERLVGAPLGQGSIVTYFKRAFPRLPLSVLMQAVAWHRVCGGSGLSDDEFNASLAPYLAAHPA